MLVSYTRGLVIAVVALTTSVLAQNSEESEAQLTGLPYLVVPAPVQFSSLTLITLIPRGHRPNRRMCPILLCALGPVY
jgi:hypothetical protein